MRIFVIIALVAAVAATLWADCVSNGNGGLATVYNCTTQVGCGNNQARGWVQVASCSYKCCVGAGFLFGTVAIGRIPALVAM